MKAQDVMDRVLSCLDEAEADGYQQQEADLIHKVGVTYGGVTGNELWIKVGEGEFLSRSVRKGKKFSDFPISI